jgi:hypothetical protein
VFPCGDVTYPLCLLDTMAVSEMALRPAGSMRSFYACALESEPSFVPCFTIYTVMELRRRPDIFGQFIEQFHAFPCVLLKGYAELIGEQAAASPDPSEIDPCAVAFTPLGQDGNQLANLPMLLGLPHLVARENYWNDGAPEIPPPGSCRCSHAGGRGIPVEQYAYP